MSTRERREREKALKLAEAKAANGGTTPPPNLKGKFPKPAIKEEIVKEEPKGERRKYKKRKRPGEDGDIVQSIEGGEVDVPSEAEKPPVKKARASKSPSPEYPPADSLTEEQLARPSEPYARLIYDILLDIHPKALPLKQIYRALKLKFPFFVHRVDSEGWLPSKRLLQNRNLHLHHVKIPKALHHHSTGKTVRPTPNRMVCLHEVLLHLSLFKVHMAQFHHHPMVCLGLLHLLRDQCHLQRPLMVIHLQGLPTPLLSHSIPQSNLDLLLMPPSKLLNRPLNRLVLHELLLRQIKWQALDPPQLAPSLVQYHRRPLAHLPRETCLAHWTVWWPLGGLSLPCMSKLAILKRLRDGRGSFIL
jgi:hypothetical protein